MEMDPATRYTLRCNMCNCREIGIGITSTFPTYLNPIKTLQNRAVKNIGSGSMYGNSNPYYVRFNILKLQDLYIVEIAKIVDNYIHRSCMLPPSFLNYFNRAHLISQRSSRSTTTHRDLLYIPLLRTKKMQRSIKYQRVKIWNRKI